MKKTRKKWKWWLLCVLTVCIVLLLLPVVSHGSRGKASDYQHHLSILTYNTHRMGWFRKAPQNRVIQYLLRQDADVICLQEVEVYKDNQYLTLGELKGVMREKYPYSYIDFSVYNSRRQFGNVVFSKYPLINKQTIRYPSRANISSRCDIVAGTDTLRLITNHLESNRFEKNDFAGSKDHNDALKETAQRLGNKWETASKARHEQARCIRREIDDSPYPVIVVGDFNDIPLSYTYLKIRGTMRDCFLSTNWGDFGFTYVYRHIGVRIDYTLCSRSLHPICSEVQHVNHSDHYPLATTIAW